jgi:hypothetical protein
MAPSSPSTIDEYLPVRTVADLPFPPGESPFRVKGNVFVRMRQFHDEIAPGGSRAVAAALRDGVLREFYTQKFITAGWYDYLPCCCSCAPRSL